MIATELPQVDHLLVVTAHPDDESFGLGAILAAFVASGTVVDVLCFTRGEASTLGEHEHDLAELRDQECHRAAEALGFDTVDILDYPDGALGDVPLSELAQHVERRAGDSELLVVFDEGGITGHPDHRRATEAATDWSQRSGVPVLAWTLSADVAATLKDEFGAGFIGRDRANLDVELSVDRTTQLKAIACHGSQATGNRVLWRRLELQANQECLRYLT